LSPDGNKIAAVENTVTNINSLVLIDVKTQAIIQSVHTPDNVYLQHPEWSADGGKLTFISLSGAGEGVISFKMNSMEWETLIDAARNDLQSSFLRNDSLFFISSSSGTDNVYLLTPDKKTEQLTRS
jgi:Tol biopolymer transport system component